MTSKYLVKFYFTTLLIGVIVTTIASLIVDYQEVTERLFTGDVPGFFLNILWIIGYGLLIATVSQIAFFIYLFLNPLGMGLSKRFWPYIQLLLVIYAVFDLFYVRYLAVGDDLNLLSYIFVPIFVVVAGFVVARYKNQVTAGRDIFIPSLFFMIFMTSITLLPFSSESTEWIYRSVFTLVICNAFQLLWLPKYIEQSKRDRKERNVEIKADRKERVRQAHEAEEKRNEDKEQAKIKKRNAMKFKNKVRKPK